MKKTVFTLSLSISIFFAYAQEEKIPNEECAAARCMERLIKTDPDFSKRADEYERTIQEFLANHPNGKTDNTQLVVNIPTVVHVVWNTASENISDNTCTQMMKILNDNFAKTNASSSGVPSVWQPIAANTGIQFCLASKDPNGNPTNGIVRKQTSETSFSDIGANADGIFFSSKGGDDAWDVTRYFNIWVCDINGFSGYSYYPTSVANPKHGSVVDYTVVLATTLTHEAGHAFNLIHTWGDDNGACTGDDKVSDTPNEADKYSSFGCTFPKTDACSPVSPGIMFMNFMDYGNCRIFFTQGQSARANAVLNVPPYNALTASPGCSAVSVNEVDMDKYIFISPNPSVDGTINVNLMSAFDLGQVSIKIYTVLGEVIAEMSENVHASKKIKLNMEDQPNGIYLVELKTSNAKATKKLILNK